MAVAEATSTSERRASLGWRVAGVILRRREASILVVAAALVAFFGFKNSAFVQLDNIKNVTESMAPYAIVGAGEVMLLICGEIDLSVGNVFALAPSLVWVLCASDQYGLPISLGVMI